jgi:predicted flap endonuclease-1-like 5' DNA nuclease
MTKLTEIEGIGATYAAKLEEVGVSSTEQLLESAASPQGRTHLATATGLSKKLILKWANRADLSRVKGIGEEYADLLEASGVDTVPALARRNPTNLTEKMAEVNEEKKLVRSVPSEKVVTKWVEQAKELPRVMTY